MSERQGSGGFEDKLKALEALVERLEDGELSLEEALKLFEQGMRLARECETALGKAEQKVQILLDRFGAPEDFPAGGADEAAGGGEDDETP
ncbi:MAG: hypothetical protein KatS3mg121_0515 [Gammaproteobacteria bacterium]|nr:MAG: hypothetical protein KatS3mg121_0515 [Gammaproteobacteria bacterium]